MDQRVWLVTGCSSGIGRAIAQAAAESGDIVVATARDPSTLTALVEGGKGLLEAARLDVTDRHAIEAVVAGAIERFGRIDVLCSNAGYGTIAALEECSDEQIERSLRTNMLGPLLLVRAVLPAMRAQRSGHILIVSAIAAFANHEGFAVYGGAKAGLEAAMEAVALDVKPMGIRVSMVLPGPTRTDFIARSLERGELAIDDYVGTSGKFGAFLRSINGKQPGDPAKIAGLMVALSREEQPPLRVVTGKYAVQRARAKLRSMQADIDAWEARSIAIDS